MGIAGEINWSRDLTLGGQLNLRCPDNAHNSNRLSKQPENRTAYYALPQMSNRFFFSNVFTPIQYLQNHLRRCCLTRGAVGS